MDHRFKFCTGVSLGNAAGQLPIYVRLTVEGKRFEYSTKKFIEPSKWSSELSRMKGSSEEARSINSLLDFTKNRINEIQFELLKENASLNIEEFRNRILGIKERERMIVPIFVEHNRKIKELVVKNMQLEHWSDMKPH